MTELLAERIATQASSSLAVVDRRESLSYRDFWTRVTGTAAGMRGMRRAAVLPTSDVGSLVAVTAAMLSGTSVVLLHRHLLPEQFARVLALTRPDVVLAAPSQHARLRKLGCTNPVDALHADGPHDTATPDDELLVGVTSGTTGEPKLFVRNQRSWATTLDRSDATFDISPGDRVAAPGVLDHTHFLYGALHALTRGASVDLRPALDALKDAPTHLYSVPTIAWDIVRAGIRAPTVREVLSSAARWPSPGRLALQEVLPNASLVHFYGASELSFVSYDRGVDPGPGTLFDGVDAEIRDTLVHVRSDMLFDGYLTDSGLVGGPVDGWMTVGDRGIVDGRKLTLFGRDSDMLIRAGLNVELAPIEAVLTAIPGVTEAAVIAVPDVRMGEAPAAAVVLGTDPPATAEIWRSLRASLPSPSIPVQLLAVEALPRTPRGKLDRDALRALLSRERDAPSSRRTPGRP
ncbi:AMP-binding protein [Rhodococcoides kyotonense]|uniref:Long-chain acyl-CoA synthetase n=1 Tax=Rhodococcoides kyotonense TaxID=398843 RepID=A0A239MLA0_9NOCA|nr:AMP-binding protein [Rhodococcus kyotonensis]SNT43043.1 long-chain acyl-CoA synthetase [Rhodococcus kyotonensis]